MRVGQILRNKDSKLRIVMSTSDGKLFCVDMIGRQTSEIPMDPTAYTFEAGSIKDMDKVRRDELNVIW